MSEANDETPAGDLPGSEGTYQVIARRYRPQRFGEVVGQEAIAESLVHAIEKDRVAHAYLFCGPRGVGKTSMARIFARALECPHRVDGEACGKCSVCLRIASSEDMDVVELDAASHRGIDDVREVIQLVRYKPTGQYRIFIVDEVHMLTREAFNALLKTLEEPPPHVKFVFATTEPEKLPPTVMSRCQRYDFTAVSPSDIVRRLEQICDAEGAKPGADVLEEIAALARGGMRDSQSLLDQLLSFAGLEPSIADLNRITGRWAPERVEAFQEAVEAGDTAAVLSSLGDLETSGVDPSVFVEQLVDVHRAQLRAGVAAGWSRVDVERSLLAQEILHETRWRMRHLNRPEVLLEAAVLRLSTLRDLVPLSALRNGTPAGKSGSATARSDENGRAAATPPDRSSRPAAATAVESRNRDPRASASAGADADSESAPPGAAPPGTETSESAPPEGVRSESVLDPAPVESGSMAVESEGGTPGPIALETGPVPVDRVNGPDLGNVAANGIGASVGDEPTSEADSTTQCIERVAPGVARLLVDAPRWNGDDLSLLVPSSSQRIVERKARAIAGELRQELGRPVRVEFEWVESSDGETREEPVATNVETPDVVRKAVEIFRGELFEQASRPRG